MHRLTATVVATTAALVGVSSATLAAGHRSTTPVTTPSGTPAAAELVVAFRPAALCIDVGGEGGVDISGISMPDLSKISLPDFTKMSLPDLTGLSLPDLTGFTMPDLTGFTMPDLTGFTMPDLTGLTMPDLSEIPGLGDTPLAPSEDGMLQIGGEDAAGFCVVGSTTATAAILEADATAKQNGDQWVVEVSVRAEGQAALDQVTAMCFTGESGCISKQLAIQVGDRVVSHPTVTSASLTGPLQIAGPADEAAAKQLAEDINAAVRAAG